MSYRKEQNHRQLRTIGLIVLLIALLIGVVAAYLDKHGQVIGKRGSNALSESEPDAGAGRPGK